MIPQTRLPSFRWIPVTAAAALVCAAAWLWLAIDVTNGPDPEPWELALFARVVLWRPTPLAGTMPFIDEIVDFVVAGALIAFSWKWVAGKARDWTELGTLWAIALGGVVLSFGLKDLIDRPRPGFATVINDSSSFPSGHTMATTLIAGYVMHQVARSTLRPWVKCLALFGCALAILVVGYSRVFVGAHYPTDVVAAILAACAWLCACIGGKTWLRRQRQRGGVEAATGKRSGHPRAGPAAAETDDPGA